MTPPSSLRRLPQALGLLMAGLASGWVLLAAGAGPEGSAAEGWWSLRPLSDPVVPHDEGMPSANPIDAFLKERLAARGLVLSPPATPRERLRRLHFDLTGMPPSPEDIAAFERDSSPAAWNRQIERLLGSPRYGERWGRHWLDVVRFAQSNGYERDGEKLHAWKYRDYVIRAFNQDTPYDRFVREQIAGDELAPDPGTAGGPPGDAWQDALIATGFLRLGVHDDEPDDRLQAEYDELDDMVSASGAAFLGLTVGCARCHDHKFDPIPQHDYYALLAAFRPLQPGGPSEHTLDSPLFAPLASPQQIAAWKAGQDRRVQALEQEIAAAADEAQKQRLTGTLAALRKASPPFDWALAARERTNTTPAVHVLARGNPRSPGAEVSPGFLRAAGGGDAPAASGPREEGTPGATSGRRTALANWIASPDNPLTARVMVNRVWHHHFGRGIVRTTTDFGRVGSLPTHPELLDWLAREFIRSGWSVKALHRLILHSAAWNQSATTPSPRAEAEDPANDLWWRQSLRRLDAEALRDSLLAISGDLNLQAGGRGIFPVLSGEVLAGGSRPGTDWEVSPPDQLARRSVYTYIRRTSLVPLLETFDYSNAASPLGERPVTTVAPQALLLLNDAFVQDQAAALAARVSRELPGKPLPQRAARAWALATGRLPAAAEVQALNAFLERQTAIWSSLDHRLSLRPDVPDTLSVPFFHALPASRFLQGPDGNWSHFKGCWPRAYEGNQTLESGRGPLALWNGAVITNGTLSVELVPQVACSQIGLLWRAWSAASETNGETGFELVLEPREGRATLRRLEPDRAVELASASGVTLREDRLPVRIAIEADHVAVWFHGQSSPALEVRGLDAGPASGRLGVRAWGSGVSLDRFTWTETGGLPIPLWPARPNTWAAQKALESACLLMLNLNEVAYVD
ncbi:MAG: DUF1553 domain-containing protein [Verrucomicrobia bacterium]|nr:DUF1553 domain-containing protein [Verrucomicrobiota bacterium]